MADRTRFALVGTGNRGTTMWGRDLLAGWRPEVDLVGICDTNPLRAERARTMIGSNAPIYTDIETTLREAKPELVIVCTPDSTHDDIIIAALEAGCNVITEKPMTTTLEKIRRIRQAERRTGRRVDVSFNYRFAPTAHRLKSLLLDGAIGTLTSIDFHWYLDTLHGADYFRRWHAYAANSGSLFVHKATHHFDLLNWYVGADPESVSAFGQLRNYGAAGPFRGERCRTCPHADRCDYFFDITTDEFLETLYEDPSDLDGYVRDACVYREDIDIPDTMTANIRYENEVVVSYSLNTYMPIEGHHIAFNGTRGRIEIRQYERQPWETPKADEILLVHNFGGGVERISVPHAPGGHYGGDNLMRDVILRGAADPLGQRAGSRAGAMSVVTGIAAFQSARTGETVRIADLGGID
ncbi:Gfo/Idh/MocA family oxidoreductase [Arsenicitalea aurantiaca]|uniref:Gfo/Idh/MocA family oxidoreductase n=1 Tax=Arsenicitalea aurantiaca TaxID=1783274 RepID=A0A433X7N8_9HYPH|nr:Gfo/Idh/MocA family oxidoreductase [Arsenicitalea aurantiaca]RUT30058.1 Gfo/Idh/MocA family oxidoreductase [Arsenicitalea aurantiaca]